MPDITVISISSADSIEIGFTPAQSYREASLIKIRRVNRLSDPAWLMFGIPECRDIIAGLKQAIDDHRFERHINWYGESHVLRMRRLVPVSSPGFVTMDLFWENPATGKPEKVQRAGTSIEIPLDLVRKVVGALQVAHDRCRPPTLGFSN